MQSPAFVAFTGVDRAEILPQMVSLSHQYPIEWGVLIDSEQEAKPLFPNAGLRSLLLDGRHLNWAAHVCGAAARSIAETGEAPGLNLAAFRRVQVNHGFVGSNDRQVANVGNFGRRRGVRAVLQCSGTFPQDQGVDWLYDVSFGTGVRPQQWPALPVRGPFCGFSGGLGPDTVVDILKAINPPSGTVYWIDMESGVRSNGLIDIDKCRKVCELIF
jgi:hypothetical protein